MFETLVVTNSVNMNYDDEDRLVKYEEVIVDSTEPEVIKTNKVDNIIYDINNRMISRREILEDSLGNIKETNISDIKYDKYGWEVGKIQTIVERSYVAGVCVYDNMQTIVTENTKYNKNGLKIFYKEKTISSVNDVEKVFVWKNAVYNSVGQVISYLMLFSKKQTD
jgi:hypothetical protein